MEKEFNGIKWIQSIAVAAKRLINVTSKFYNEILVELGETVRREERRRTEGEERITEEHEKVGREARKKERRGN